MAEALDRAGLAAAIRSGALLEGDFLLRSGRRSSYYLDKYRLGTRPALLRAIGSALARAVREHDPEATMLAAPELGAVPLAASVSLETELPFLIVRKEAKRYGTANRIEGTFEPGERVCLIEDVVTSGGAAIEAVRALRDAGLLLESAVCVLEREEGGLEALALEGVRLKPLYLAADIRPATQERMVERYPT